MDSFMILITIEELFTWAIFTQMRLQSGHRKVQSTEGSTLPAPFIIPIFPTVMLFDSRPTWMVSAETEGRGLQTSVKGQLVKTLGFVATCCLYQSLFSFTTRHIWLSGHTRAGCSGTWPTSLEFATSWPKAELSRQVQTCFQPKICSR